MRILYVCNEYPPAPHGGIGSVVQTLARGVATSGNEAVVIGLDPTQRQSGWTTDGSVDVYRISANLRQSPELHWRGKTWSLAQLQASRHLSDHLNRLIKVIKPDLVESHDWSGPLWSHPGTPLIVRLHGCSLAHAPVAGGSAGRLDHYLERRNLRMADALVAVSRDIAIRTSRAAGIDIASIVGIYNGVDTAMFSRRPGPRVEAEVLFPGTVSERKGVREIFAALPGIHTRVPSARFTFVGRLPPGGEQSVLWKQHRSGLPPSVRERVRFRAPQPYDEMPAIYSRSTVAVFASLSEAFGMACVEAMACETPVVMTSRGSGPEIITDRVSGRLVAPTDTGALVAAVVELLDDSALRQNLADAARGRVEQYFSASRQIKTNLDFYASVVENRTSKWKTAA